MAIGCCGLAPSVLQRNRQMPRANALIFQLAQLLTLASRNKICGRGNDRPEPAPDATTKPDNTIASPSNQARQLPAKVAANTQISDASIGRAALFFVGKGPDIFWPFSLPQLPVFAQPTCFFRTQSRTRSRLKLAQCFKVHIEMVAD